MVVVSPHRHDCGTGIKITNQAATGAIPLGEGVNTTKGASIFGKVSKAHRGGRIPTTQQTMTPTAPGLTLFGEPTVGPQTVARHLSFIFFLFGGEVWGRLLPDSGHNGSFL